MKASLSAKSPTTDAIDRIMAACFPAGEPVDRFAVEQRLRRLLEGSAGLSAGTFLKVPAENIPSLSQIALKKIEFLRARGYVEYGLAMRGPNGYCLIGSLGDVRWASEVQIESSLSTSTS